MPEKFVNDLETEYLRVAAGPRPTEEVGPSDAVSVLTSCGCPRVMAGVYLEQRSSNPPILVSVTVFPMPDSTTAEMTYNFLQKDGSYFKELTLWSAQTNSDGSPRRSSFSDGYFWRAHIRWTGRYVITVRALRTDLAAEAGLYPYVLAATTRASRSCGPENYGKR